MKVIVTLLFIIFFGTINAQESTNNIQVSTFSIEAPQLKATKKIWVYLPKDYTLYTKKKYSVIYMHDGQNLFDAKTSFAGEWNIDETLDSISAQVIIIGIENGREKRTEELTPFKNKKYGGGNADNYLKFIVETLKPFVDKTYKTKSNYKNTGLWGSSLGGLVSFYGALKYPEVFGKVGCFSPSFWFNRKEVFDIMEHTKIFKTKIYFLCGDDEDDFTMVQNLNKMEYQINTKRCECQMLNKKIIVKGGKHNEKLWREGFKKAYLWLF